MSSGRRTEDPTTMRQLDQQGIETYFHKLVSETGRQGIIGFCPVDRVRLLSEQRQYLEDRLARLGPAGRLSAVSLGLTYHEPEIRAIPGEWAAKPSQDGRWNLYARAYETVNQQLAGIALALAEQFGGVVEPPTLDGWVGKVQQVGDYFPHCVSHRAFAEQAGLGWRGRHGLIVTPKAGPALRLATVFLPGIAEGTPGEIAGCGECHACLDVCPVLSVPGDYREACRRRINALGLENEVCGICVRVCWEKIRR